MNRGLTLIELLVVTSIALLVVGIATPVIVAARNRSYDAQELSAMRQMGQAAQLYWEQFGCFPGGVTPLVRQQFLPASLCAAARDRSTYGIANEIVMTLRHGSALYNSLLPEFRNSYVGLYEFGYVGKRYEAMIADREAVGWLISLAKSRKVSNANGALGPYEGDYYRLLFDGSVQVRRHRPPLSIGSHARKWVPLSLFADVSDQWIAEFS